MIRTNFYFPKPLLDRLRALADKEGLSMSEIIRRALEADLKARGF